MQIQRAFTLLEMAVVLALILLAVSLWPTRFSHGSRARYSANSVVCATNLKDNFTAMYVYSIMHKDRFPVAGDADPAGSAIGFREGSRQPGGTPATLDNNVTAALWMTVRDGSRAAKGFICPNTNDDGDPLTTTIGGSIAANLKETHDFLERRNLSYSPINMYHVTASRFWSSNVPPDYLLMGDNNGTDHPQRHTLGPADDAEIIDIAERENSPNHGWAGQNLQWGDGHVVFVNDPFQGRGGDNVYAMTRGGLNRPPTLGNSDGDVAQEDSPLWDQDVWLLPVSGNGGVSLSGLPDDVIATAPPRPFPLARVIIGGAIGLLIVAALVAVVRSLFADSARKPRFTS